MFVLQSNKTLASQNAGLQRSYKKECTENASDCYMLQKFGFIKRVDKGEITTVKDLES